MTTPKTTVAQVTVSDGTEIAYRRHGTEGLPRLVLIHSLALDSSVWDGVVERLAGRAEIICIDCRGHGRSGRPAGPYTVELLADDIAELLQQIGWDKVIVAGCSMGGCVAQAFTARHQNLVTALALIDTTAWYGSDAPKEWRDRAAKARADGFAAMSEFQATRWFGDRFRRDHPDLVQHAIDVFSRNDIDAYAATCAMLGDADLRPHLAEFQIPVAVIVGEHDYATPVAMAQDLVQRIPQATLTVLTDARHLTPIECPGEIAAAIEQLIKQTSP